MKHLLKLIASIFILIGFCACNHQCPAMLVEIDSLLLSNPKLALKQLKYAEAQIDTTNISDVMYMRLLSQLTRDRLYMEKKDVNYMQQILSFYENGKDNDKLSKSYYLLARSLADLQDDFHALFYYQKALGMLEKTGNMRLRALIYHQIGYIMKSQDDLVQAKSFFAKSYECDSILADTSAMAFALMDMAVLDMATQQDRKANEKLYKALSYAKVAKNDSLLRSVELQLANSYIYETNNMDSVWHYLQSSLCNITKSNFSTVCLVASEYYWSVGKMPQAKSYLIEVLSKGDVYCKQEACRRLISFYTYNGDVDTSQFYLTKYLAYGDSIFNLKNKESKRNGNVLYGYILQKDKLDELNRQVRNKTLLAIGLSIGLVIIVFALLFYFQMSVVKKLKLNNKLNKIKLSAFSKVEREELLKDKIIRQLCLNSYALSQRHLDAEEWQKIDTYVNSNYPGFKEQLYSLHDLSEQEYHICLLLKINIGTAQISIFTAHTMQSISMSKQRIYKKLTAESGRAGNLVDFLKTL